MFAVQAVHMEGGGQSGTIHRNQHHFRQEFDLHLEGSELNTSEHKDGREVCQSLARIGPELDQ